MVEKVKKIIASNLWIRVFIFFLAFIVRVIFILTLENELFWPDERAYDGIAWGIVQGKGYLAPSYRAPGWPSFLAGIYFLFGHSFFWARAAQVVLGSLMCLLVYSIAVKIFDKKTAFLSTFVSIFYPPFIYISGVLYPTNLFTLLLALSIFLLLKLKTGRSSIIYILTGFCFGLATLCRPIFLSFIPFGLFYIFTFQEKAFTKKIGRISLVLFVTLLTISPWIIRNYIVYNKFVLVSTGGYMLWSGNNPLAKGNSDDRRSVAVELNTNEWLDRLSKNNPDEKCGIERLRKVLSGADEIERDKILQREAIRFMWENPGHTGRLFIRKFVALYTPFTKTMTQNVFTSSRNKMVVSFAFYPILFFAFIGFFFSLPQWRKTLIFYFVIFSLSLTYAIFTVCTRFRIPVDPYLIILASFATVKIFSKLKPVLHTKE